MSEKSKGQYVPGTYAKGDDKRVAHTASEAVALTFQGYKLVSESVVDPGTYDPSEHNADEVVAHLKTVEGDVAEHDRIVKAELEGKNRSTITNQA